jgi:predicted metal-dependent HD superfamily phosphohydrolase
MNYHEQLIRIAEHVALFYFEHTDERLLYHKPTHTAEILEAVKKMASHYQLDEPAHFIVCAAAWFHNTGYHLPGKQDPESKSSEMAGIFLTRILTDDKVINTIKNCILATRIPQSPASLPEKIVCDAVLFYLGRETFKEKDKLLKKEFENVGNCKISGTDWRSLNIALFESHHFHTDYCESSLKKTKIQNLANIKQKQEERSLTPASPEPPGVLPGYLDNSDLYMPGKVPQNNMATQRHYNSLADNKDKKKEKKNSRRLRGIETMFRITSTNHQRMSALADNKANIMISVNTIIISVIISLIIPRFESNSRLVIPTIILLAVSITAIIYSILATRPRLQKGIFTREQVEKKSVNLLFYGSFYKMGFKDYQYGMEEMMNDRDFLYGSLVKDIYWQGCVMGRKFHMLRIAYDIFMYGIAVSVVAYALAAVIIK